MNDQRQKEEEAKRRSQADVDMNMKIRPTPPMSVMHPFDETQHLGEAQRFLKDHINALRRDADTLEALMKQLPMELSPQATEGLMRLLSYRRY